MAVDVFSLVGKIAVDYSEANSNLDSIRDTASKTADSLGDVDEAAEDAGDSVEEAGDSADEADDKFTVWKATLGNLAAQAITALIAKVTELAKEIVNLGIDTETAFAKLETISGTEYIDDLTASITELSKETGVSSAELANVAYNAISAGASAEEAMDMVEAATKLGVAGFTDAESALSVLSTAINSYGDAAGTAAEISDSLIMVQNLGVTTIGELASSMGKAIATGSAYSVNLSNLESAYVSITKAGISTEESTTYLNSMLNELGDTGSDVSAILEEQTGKSFSELMNDGYSLADVLEILYESCDEDSTALMNLWSSAEAGKASNAIINQGLEAFNENLETISNSAGATESAYATMADTMETKISIMQQGFASLGLKIYEGLEEPLSSAITFVTNTVIPGIQGFMNKISGADFSPITESVADLQEKMEPLVEIISEGLSWAYDNVLEPLASWAISSGVPAVLEYLGEVFSFISSVLKVLQPLASWLWNSFLQPLASFMANSFISNMELVTDILGAVSSLIEAIPAAFDTAWTIISNMVDEAITAVSAAWETIQNIVQFGILFIESLLDAAFQILTLPWQFIWVNFGDYLIEAWETIKEIISSALDALYNVISSVLNTISSIISSVMTAISTKISNILNSVQSTFRTIWEGIKSTVSDAIDGAKTTISNGLTSAYDTVTSILTNIKDKFTSIFDSAKSIVSNAIETIKGYFNFEWSLPNIKLPHFNITGSFSLNPPSVPSFGVEWYKKAMEDGMIMNDPTIFGYNAETNKLLAGGEAGSETVVGTDNLMNMIQQAVNNSSSNGIIEILGAILNNLEWFTAENFADMMITILTKYVTFKYNDRELGKLVRKYTK